MRDMTTGNAFLHVLRFALPLLLGSVLIHTHVFIDSAIVGHFIGAEALAAIGIAGSIVYFLVAISIGLNMGFSILLSQYFGAQDDVSVHAAIRNLLFFSMLFAVAVMGIGLWVSSDVLLWMNVPEALFQPAYQYLTLTLYGLVFSYCLVSMGTILRAMGDAMTPLVPLVISSAINLGLDLYFIVQLGMGVEGAALASVMAQAVVWFGFGCYVFCRIKVFRQAFHHFSISYRLLWAGVKVGVPLAVQQVFLSVGILVLTAIVAPFGVEVVAAFSIVGRIESLALIIFIELSAALTTFTAQNFGQGLWLRIRYAAWNTVLLATVLSVFLSWVTYWQSTFFITLFTYDESVVRIAEEYLRTLMPFLSFLTLTVVLHGVFNGMGNVVVPMLCTLYAFCIARVVFSKVLGDYYGEAGLWWSAVFGWIVGFVYTVMVFLKVLKQQSLLRVAV